MSESPIPSRNSEEVAETARIHSTAFVDPGARIGQHTRVWHFCHIDGGARIGDHCVIGQGCYIAAVVIGNNVRLQNNVSVYAGVVLEDDVFCGPSMVFTNVINPRSAVSRKHEFQATHVRRGATIGANATIVCGVTIGEYAFIGAGALLRTDVPARAVMVGVPATQNGWMCDCGLRLDAQLRCACKKEYQRRSDGVFPLSA